jgi:hypothetical protein
MTNKELAARVLLVIRSSQEKALRNRFTRTPNTNPASATAVGGSGPSPDQMLEEAVAELSEQQRTNLEEICARLIESLKR